MTFGAEIWGPALISAAGSMGAGWLSGAGSKQRETKMQRTQRKLVDDLIASLKGGGSYSDLFSSDPELFQKSFVEPAMSKFRNQTAPQIQQQYIASGQQRGTGLDDQLLRAGVEMDQLLNQQMYQFNQDAMNRKQNTMNNILGQSSGATRGTTGGQDIMAGAAGYLGSEQFADTAAKLFKKSTPEPLQRKGFEND